MDEACCSGADYGYRVAGSYAALLYGSYAAGYGFDEGCLFIGQLFWDFQSVYLDVCGWDFEVFGEPAGFDVRFVELFAEGVVAAEAVVAC